jgi:drug/metabolite transporter (DMT)-like permease
MSISLISGNLVGIPTFEIAIPNYVQLLLLILLGVIATIGHFMIAYAIKYLEASTLAPFQYLEIVAATFYGLWLFGDFPNALAWFGTIIIVGSGIYTFSRERLKDNSNC